MTDIDDYDLFYISPEEVLDTVEQAEAGFEDARLKIGSVVSFRPPDNSYVREVSLAFEEGQTRAVVPKLKVDMGRFGEYVLEGYPIDDEYSLEEYAAEVFSNAVDDAIMSAVDAAAGEYNERVVRESLRMIAEKNKDSCTYDDHRDLLFCQVGTPDGRILIELSPYHWW